MPEKFDNEASLRAAKEKLPLHVLMEQRGDPAVVGRKWAACPFCKKKDTARITSDGGQEFFKCANASCPSGTSDKGKAWTELAYFKFKTGLNDKEAFIAYLKEAGVWIEREKKTGSSTEPRGRPGEPGAPEKTEVPKPPDGSSPPSPRPSPPGEGAAADDDDVLGQAVLEYFYSKLTPTESQMVLYLEGGGKIPDPIPAELVKRIKFRPVSLFEKRGLDSATCATLGFRANPESNLKILLDLEKKFSVDALLASGLWQPKKKNNPRRPNKQFYGLGQIGKKPETERRNKDDKWVWGKCLPVLIPYFDEYGKLSKLRPHKGGAPEGTLCGAARIYVPRDFRKCADGEPRPESYRLCIICEGEYKAAALWRILGAGRTDAGAPLGVCAIPGINFGKNFELRLELEAWLEQVGCRTVVIGFDDQDKSDKPREQRHEAMKWARYLCADLSRKLGIIGKVCVLPQAWRDAKGKADWDGALAKFVMEEALT